MQNNRLYLFVVIFSELLLCHSSAEVVPLGWPTFDSPDGLFSIRLPMPPTERKDLAGIGKKNSFYTCFSKELDCQFEIFCGELPLTKETDTVEKVFKKFIATHSSANAHGKLIESRIFKWNDKHPACELSLRDQVGQEKEKIRKTVVVMTPKENVHVQIIVTGSKASIESKQITDCLESLTIKE